jgi:hypothetical protein
LCESCLMIPRPPFALPEGTARIEIGMHRPEGEGIVPYGEIIKVELDLASSFKNRENVVYL